MAKAAARTGAGVLSVREALGQLPPGLRTEHDEPQSVTALYFDTADRALAGAGLRLSCSPEPDRTCWLLVRGGDPVHEASADPAAEPPREVPAGLADLLLARTRGEPLTPVLRVQRTTAVSRVTGPGGTVQLADVHTRAETLGADTALHTWRVVQRTGRLDKPAAAALDAALARLAVPAGGDQLDRLLAAPYATAATAATAAVRVRSAKDPARLLLTARLREQVAELIERDLQVRLAMPDAVHKMRVATRRLRSLLKTAEPLLDAGPAAALRAELGWLAGELGSVRDREVMLAHLRDRLAELPGEQVLGPVAARIEQQLTHEELVATESLRDTLRSRRYAALLEQLAGFAAAPPCLPPADRPAHRVLPRLVGREGRRLRRRVRHAQGLGDGPDRDAALHEARKVAKRLRYAAETVAPAYGRPARKLAARAERMQEILGARQDSVVIRQFLRAEGARAGTREGENGYTYGLLAGLEQGRAREADREFAVLWRKVGTGRALRRIG